VTPREGVSTRSEPLRGVLHVMPHGLAQHAAPLQERLRNARKNKNGRDACACRPEFVCEAVIPVRGSHPD
jgi:hypothetical protein